ncbi:MAG: hypothetical protein LBR15_05195 [Methanobrevibacter sp.]|jgi:hypothetical protein|nr:hypothetical protein [Candidatus Methanovirga australis]
MKKSSYIILIWVVGVVVCLSCAVANDTDNVITVPLGATLEHVYSNDVYGYGKDSYHSWHLILLNSTQIDLKVPDDPSFIGKPTFINHLYLLGVFDRFVYLPYSDESVEEWNEFYKEVKICFSNPEFSITPTDDWNFYVFKCKASKSGSFKVDKFIFNII